MAWKDLSMKERAAYIRTAVRNGIEKLDDIKLAYNEFALGENLYYPGGPLEELEYKLTSEETPPEYPTQEAPINFSALPSNPKEAIMLLYLDNKNKGGLWAIDTYYSQFKPENKGADAKESVDYATQITLPNLKKAFDEEMNIVNKKVSNQAGIKNFTVPENLFDLTVNPNVDIEYKYRKPIATNLGFVLGLTELNPDFKRQKASIILAPYTNDPTMQEEVLHAMGFGSIPYGYNVREGITYIPEKEQKEHPDEELFKAEMNAFKSFMDLNQDIIDEKDHNIIINPLTIEDPVTKKTTWNKDWGAHVTDEDLKDLSPEEVKDFRDKVNGYNLYTINNTLGSKLADALQTERMRRIMNQTDLNSIVSDLNIDWGLFNKDKATLLTDEDKAKIQQQVIEDITQKLRTGNGQYNPAEDPAYADIVKKDNQIKSLMKLISYYTDPMEYIAKGATFGRLSGIDMDKTGDWTKSTFNGKTMLLILEESSFSPSPEFQLIYKNLQDSGAYNTLLKIQDINTLNGRRNFLQWLHGRYVADQQPAIDNNVEERGFFGAYGGHIYDGTTEESQLMNPYIKNWNTPNYGWSFSDLLNDLTIKDTVKNLENKALDSGLLRYPSARPLVYTDTDQKLEGYKPLGDDYFTTIDNDDDEVDDTPILILSNMSSLLSDKDNYQMPISNLKQTVAHEYGHYLDWANNGEYSLDPSLLNYNLPKYNEISTGDAIFNNAVDKAGGNTRKARKFINFVEDPLIVYYQKLIKHDTEPDELWADKFMHSQYPTDTDRYMLMHQKALGGKLNKKKITFEEPNFDFKDQDWSLYNWR